MNTLQKLKAFNLNFNKNFLHVCTQAKRANGTLIRSAKAYTPDMSRQETSVHIPKKRQSSPTIHKHHFNRFPQSKLSTNLYLF